MTDTFNQIRLVSRALVRDRAFSGIAVILLAAGIAANITIFAVFDAALLRPLPFQSPERLVHVSEINPAGMPFVASEPNYLDFRDGQRTFTGMAAMRQANLDLTGSGEPARLRGTAVTPSFFEVLGVRPAAGREFTGDDDAAVVVLRHDVWVERFGASRDAISSSISLSGREHVIVGVMPEGFAFGETELWVPLRPSHASDRFDHWLDVIGRLQPGVTAGAAEEDLARVAADIANAHPQAAGWGVMVEPLTQWIVGTDVARGIRILMSAVGLLLLLACANVSNLFLARGSARQGELAVRSALGAGRATLVRLLAMEALLIALAGAAVGLLLSTWCLDAVSLLAGDRIPRLDNIALGRRHVLFAFSLALATAMLSGVLPALRASAVDLHSLMRASGRVVGRQSGRTRGALVVAQIMAATILLLGSGLLVRSFIAMRNGETGMDIANLHAVPIELTSARYTPDGAVSIFYQNLSERIGAIPGVVAVGASTAHPFTNWRLVNDVTPVDRAADTPPSGFMRADWRVVTTDYFDAAGVRLLRGRLFATTDMRDNPTVAVVTSTFAERMWPGADPVGNAFYWGGTSGDPITVIGVVEDVQDMAVAEGTPPLMFLSTRQLSMPMMTLLVRTARPVPGLADAIRSAVRAQDPDVPVPTVERVSDSRAAVLAAPRMHAALLAVFAVIALLVACVGIYALVSYQIATRKHELGIRAALGAGPRALLSLALRRTAALVGLGLTLGMASALALRHLLESMLYETASLDALTFTAAPALLFTTALLAAWLPARRSMRIDPLSVMKVE